MSDPWRVPHISPLAVTAGVCVALYVMAGVTEPSFFSLRALCGLFANQAVLGIVAVGLTFVILSGGIDLSVGAVVGCASIGAAWLVEHQGWHPVLAMLVVLGAAASCGAFMGALIHGLRIPAFIVTLGGMFIARGVSFSISSESIAVDHRFYGAVLDLPASAARMLGSSDSAASQFSYHLPVASTFLLLVLVAGLILLSRTPFGRSVHAIGGSEVAARLMGVRVGRTRVAIYALSGGCAGLAGLVHSLSLSSGDPSAGVLLELDAIAAVVIGGTLLSGGVGSLWGTLLGMLIFGIIETWIATREGLNSAWTRIIVGGLLLAFILVQQALLSRK